MKKITRFLKNEAGLYRRYPVKILIDGGILGAFAVLLWIVFHASRLIAH
jgi:hypothetical protein